MWLKTGQKNSKAQTVSDSQWTGTGSELKLRVAWTSGRVLSGHLTAPASNITVGLQHRQSAMAERKNSINPNKNKCNFLNDLPVSLSSVSSGFVLYQQHTNVTVSPTCLSVPAALTVQAPEALQSFTSVHTPVTRPWQQLIWAWCSLWWITLLGLVSSVCRLIWAL